MRRADLRAGLRRQWALSADNLVALPRRGGEHGGSPGFTTQGRYQTQGWTERTLGFEVGAALLQNDATGDDASLTLRRQAATRRTENAVTLFHARDHGFTCTGTCGALLRLMHEGRIPRGPWE